MTKYSCKFQLSDFTLAWRILLKERCIVYYTFHLICLPFPLLLVGITDKYLFQTWVGSKRFLAMTTKNSQEEIFDILRQVRKYWYEWNNISTWN